MNNQQDECGIVIKQLNLIFLLSFLFQLVFLGIAYFLIGKNGPYGNLTENSINILQYIAIILVLIILPGSDYLFKKRLINIKKGLPASLESLNEYRLTFIIKLGMLEFLNVLMIIALLITGLTKFALFAGIPILFFLLNRPTQTKLNTDLESKKEE